MPRQWKLGVQEYLAKLKLFLRCEDKTNKKQGNVIFSDIKVYVHRYV